MDANGKETTDQQSMDHGGSGADPPVKSVSSATGVVFSPLVQRTFQRARGEFLLTRSNARA